MKRLPFVLLYVCAFTAVPTLKPSHSEASNPLVDSQTVFFSRPSPASSNHDAVRSHYGRFTETEWRKGKVILDEQHCIVLLPEVSTVIVPPGTSICSNTSGTFCDSKVYRAEPHWHRCTLHSCGCCYKLDVAPKRLNWNTSNAASCARRFFPCCLSFCSNIYFSAGSDVIFFGSPVPWFPAVLGCHSRRLALIS